MLTVEAKAILQLLVNSIRSGYILPENEESFIGYMEAHQKLGLKLLGGGWGKSLENQGLQDLGQWTSDSGLPAITGLIVDQKTFRPGVGYFQIFQPISDERKWWIEQVRSAIAFDWSPYVDDDPVPTREDILAVC